MNKGFIRHTGITMGVALLAIAAISSAPIFAEQSNVYATITVDCDPSVELSVDKFNKVTAVTPLNDHARQLVLTKIQGMSADTAVLAVVQAARDKGYINQAKNPLVIMTAVDQNPKDDVTLTHLMKRLTKSVSDSPLTEKTTISIQTGTVEEQQKSLTSKIPLGILAVDASAKAGITLSEFFNTPAAMELLDEQGVLISMNDDDDDEDEDEDEDEEEDEDEDVDEEADDATDSTGKGNPAHDCSDDDDDDASDVSDDGDDD